MAVANRRLTTPDEDNAYARYLEVLRLDPKNEQALTGINNIAERYLTWALQNAERGQLKQARHYVQLAETIDPQQPNILPVARRINDMEEIKSVRFKLPESAVRQRNKEALPLAEIAAQLIKERPFVEIRASDDASGRWIYQCLNETVAFRINAAFFIHDTPSVTLQFPISR